ncbi:hypothetical protein SOCE26_060470 [Sorangium cellulosum]|uniref:GYF domain-containing protein n=1 Tax=Sorangium cellulosum TaxID=56 RepID=A0A2L0EZ45_SORCE|nr:DUF4339 domain-containing protein [Sorangium cellulosum]AUX44581.1 hypothetical protein SOCE26_060470 [Sorangium cellulosum]
MQPAPANDGREGLWHVAIAPDDVKVLTLDQLDDLFRLNVIDESTKIWRQGMVDWQTLGVVAGLEPESSRSQSPASASRPVAAAVPAAQPLEDDPPTPVASHLSSGAPLSAMNDSAPLSRSAALDPQAAGAAALVHPAPLAAVPARHELAGAEPHARGAGRAQRWMLALSVLAGLSVTLYRNDVLRDAAHSAGQDGAYQKLESALGGPGFGTPRSLEKLGLSSGKTR